MKLWPTSQVNRFAFSVLALALASGACRSTNPESAPPASALDPGIVAASMDPSVPPGDDFFAYANGAWVKNTPIPDDRANIGGFYIADLERERLTRELLDAILTSSPAPGSNEAKIASYYNAYLDTDAIDRAALGPARADMDAIAEIADKKQLSAA